MFVTERDINKKESTLTATFLVKKLFFITKNWGGTSISATENKYDTPNYVACVESVSVRFRSKERGTRPREKWRE